VFQRHDDESWELETSNLADLRAAMSPEVFDEFAACFIFTDRLDSLISFYNLSLKAFPSESVAENRNFYAFYAFASGTLKELSLHLAWLRGALVKKGYWEKQAWAKLKVFEDWGQDPENSLVRNQFSFHVDLPTLSSGLSSIALKHGRTLLSGGSDSRNKNSWFAVAHEATLEALRLRVADLQRTVGVPAQLLDAGNPLGDEFLRVLEVAGLKPIYCRIKGGR
jgi:hypothetical protein